MKYLFLILFFGSTMLLSLSLQSQNNPRFRIHDRIVTAKLREIKAKLKLDQATYGQFYPLYLKYDKELSDIDFRKPGRFLKVDADSLSTEEADQLIVNQLEIAKLLISIREKYYKEFKSVLSPQQIIKLYQTEAELRKKVIVELKKRIQ